MSVLGPPRRRLIDSGAESRTLVSLAECRLITSVGDQIPAIPPVPTGPITGTDGTAITGTDGVAITPAGS